MTVEHLLWIAAGAIALIGVRWAVERAGHAVLTWHKERHPPKTPVAAHEDDELAATPPDA